MGSDAISRWMGQVEVFYVIVFFWVNADLGGWVTELKDFKQVLKRHWGFRFPILLVAGKKNVD